VAGAGRTTTLYAAVRDLAASGRKVATVEDPAELELDGIAQHTVDRRTGAAAAATLRDVLATAPEVVAVGDADDAETLRTAAEAAADRLVVAVVSAASPIDAVQRVVAAGVRPETAARVLRGVAAQRLLRQVCTACARPAVQPFTPEEVRLERAFGAAPARRAVGCARCGQSGYRGVVPVAQVMLVTPRLAGLIAIGAPPAQLAQVAVDGGMRTLVAAAQARIAEGATTLQEAARTFGAIEAPAQPAPLRALVADDDAETILLATAVLEQEGLHCVPAPDGVEALARLGDGREFALVILDLNMPRLDGRETLRRIKSSMATAGLPVVVLTGSQDPADEIQVMEDGAADYIRKPIDPPRFLARVRAALRRHAGERAGV
jgi:CheY-like chemotaxis protein